MSKSAVRFFFGSLRTSVLVRKMHEEKRARGRMKGTMQCLQWPHVPKIRTPRGCASHVPHVNTVAARVLTCAPQMWHLDHTFCSRGIANAVFSSLCLALTAGWLALCHVTELPTRSSSASI